MIRSFLVILGLLLCLNVEAATYFVDATGTGTGTANGSSVSNQCAGPADADCTAAAGGDTVYLCNAATATVTLADSGTSDSSRLTYDTSCPGGTPMTINGGDSATVCLTIQGSHLNVLGIPGNPWTSPGNLTVIRDCTLRGIMLRTAISNVTVQYFNVSGIDGTTQSDQEGVGVIVDNVTSVGTTTPVQNILISDIYTHHNGAFGAKTSAGASGLGVTFRRIRADYNGSLYHGGGIFLHPYRANLTSGWSVVSGTIYERNSLSSTDDVDAAYWVNNTQHLTDIGTCGSPASGEFCYTPGAPGVGFFRVNIGQDPNGQTIQYRRNSGKYVIEDSSASYNIANDGTHGSGFQADDLAGITSGEVVIRRSYANNNDGAGIKVYRNKGTEVRGVLAWDNGQNASQTDGERSGLNIDESDGVVVRNGTFSGNAKYGVQTGKGTNSLTNIVATYNGLYGARAVTGTANLTYSDFFGNTSGATTTASGGTLNNTSGFTVSPEFVGGTSPTTKEGFRLSSGSSLRRVGNELNIGNYGDVGNRAFSHPPTPGAWEIGSGDEVLNRTTASTRTNRN